MIRNPRPRWDANISPISTPSRHSENPMRSPLVISGSTAGTSTVLAVCTGVRRSARAVRRNTGGMFFTAPNVNSTTGISPWITPKAIFADGPRPNTSSITG